MITPPKDAAAAVHPDELVTLPKDLFEQMWPLVSSVYTFRNKKLQQKGTIEVEHGECRLKKNRNNPVNPGSNDSEIKRRNNTTQKDQCLVTVKLTRQITGLNPTVALEREDEHKHLHSLETSFLVI